MTGDTDFVLRTLKELDRGKYLACLYLPGNIRTEIATLWAFNAEISRIPDLVSEPLPGEIRLQWWRDLIKSGDNAGSGPLARSLIAVIEKHNLPRESFHIYLEAKIFDLYQDPMPDTGTFEGYLGETVSGIFQNAALIAGAERNAELAEASGHAGMALGIASLLMEAAKHRARGRSFFPLDLLQQHGLDGGKGEAGGGLAWLVEPVGQGHISCVASLLDLALQHLSKARLVLPRLAKPVRPVFLSPFRSATPGAAPAPSSASPSRSGRPDPGAVPGMRP